MSASASFAVEEFVGNGVLLQQLDNLIADGWADVPTLKVMNKEDMELVGLTQRQWVRSSDLGCVVESNEGLVCCVAV